MGHAEIFIFTNTNGRGGMRQISAAETEVRLSLNMKPDSGFWNETLT